MNHIHEQEELEGNGIRGDVENLITAVTEGVQDLLPEEDVDNFLENERIASSQTTISEIDDQYIPREGMEFSSANEAQKYFNNYAYLAGFAAIIAHHARTQSKKRNNEVI